MLAALPVLREEAQSLSADGFKAWQATRDPANQVWGKLANSALDKSALKTLTKDCKEGAKRRLKLVKVQIKSLVKLEAERAQRIAEINHRSDRETAEVNEALVDLRRICADPKEASRYFTVAERTEIEENEFNLNLPRYVDTWEQIPLAPIETVIKNFKEAALRTSHLHNDVLEQFETIANTEE